jgi:hypothetical protein
LCATSTHPLATSRRMIRRVVVSFGARTGALWFFAFMGSPDVQRAAGF